MAGSPVDPKTYTTDYVESDYAKTTFLGDPHIDALVVAVQSLGGEVWTTRRRLYIIETLMAKKIPVTPAAIQGYVPTDEEDRRWKADRDRLVTGIMEPFLRASTVAYGTPEMMKYDPYKEPDVARKAPASVGESPNFSPLPPPAPFGVRLPS